MQLGKRITLFHPKACYMMFELNETFNLSESEQKKKTEIKTETESEILESAVLDTIMYNGPVKIFTTSRELNDYLSKEIATGKTSSDIERKLYKGHIFSAREFPLQTEDNDNITFVIEKVDNSTCFVEQVTSLGDAAQSIEEEINMLSQHGNVEGLEPSEIADYMVFHGKHMSLSYYCYDYDSNI
jgi:hypothetical protein